MSETYVTYRVWGGCRAPLNLEYDGRLIGEIAKDLTVDRDELLALAEDMRGYCIERQITPWVAGRIYDRIREACGEGDGRAALLQEVEPYRAS